MTINVSERVFWGRVLCTGTNHERANNYDRLSISELIVLLCCYVRHGGELERMIDADGIDQQAERELEYCARICAGVAHAIDSRQ